MSWLTDERADVYAGLTWERGYVAIGFTREHERHAGESRPRFKYPERVFGYPAEHSLRELEACGERVCRLEDETPFDNWYVDVVRSRLVVETEGDVVALQRRLKAECGPMIEVMRGYGPAEAC